MSDVSIPTFDVFGLEAINTVIAGIKESTLASEVLEKKKESLVNELANKSGLSREKMEEILKSINSIESELSRLNSDPVEKVLIELQKNNDSIKEICKEAKEGVLKDLINFSYDRSQQPLYYLMTDEKQQISETIGKTTIPQIIAMSDLIRGRLENYVEKIGDVKSQYSSYIKTPEVAMYLDKEKGDQRVKDKSEEASNKIGDAEKEFNDALASISKEKMAVYLKELIHLINNSCTTYTSMPFQHNGDISKLSLAITPRKDEYGLQTYSADYLFPKKRSYAGISVSFYYSGMSDDVYSIIEEYLTDSTSQYRIIDEEPTKGEIGIASLLHYGWKTKKEWLGFHATIGPAISLDSKVKPRLAAGFGAGFGKTRNMFTVNILGMAGYTDKLSNGYKKENETYKSKPESVTVSKLVYSWGISLGYIYKF